MSLNGLVYSLLDVSQVWRLFRWLNRHNVRILMYHGVTDEPLYAWTQLSVAAFDRQMQYIRRFYQPISLAEAQEMLSGKRPVTPHAVVVTFDDGFKNNATIAYPILKKYNIPATIFVTTSFIDQQTRHAGLLWVDYVYGILEGTQCLDVDLTDLGLGRHDLRTIEARSRAKSEICRLLKQRDFREKNQLIDAIRNRVGGTIRPEVRAALAPLTWEDIGRLLSEQLVSFGAHTVYHEVLSRLPETIMELEIIESQAQLQERTGVEVEFFAYPNGTPDDFTERARATVAQRFTCALTTIDGHNKPGEDPYLLRRIAVGRDTTFSLFRLSLSGITEFIHRVRRSFGLE